MRATHTESTYNGFQWIVDINVEMSASPGVRKEWLLIRAIQLIMNRLGSGFRQLMQQEEPVSDENYQRELWTPLHIAFIDHIGEENRIEVQWRAARTVQAVEGHEKEAKDKVPDCLKSFLRRFGTPVDFPDKIINLPRGASNKAIIITLPKYAPNRPWIPNPWGYGWDGKNVWKRGPVMALLQTLAQAPCGDPVSTWMAFSLRRPMHKERMRQILVDKDELRGVIAFSEDEQFLGAGGDDDSAPAAGATGGTAGRTSSAPFSSTSAGGEGGTTVRIAEGTPRYKPIQTCLFERGPRTVLKAACQARIETDQRVVALPLTAAVQGQTAVFARVGLPQKRLAIAYEAEAYGDWPVVPEPAPVILLVRGANPLYAVLTEKIENLPAPALTPDLTERLYRIKATYIYALSRDIEPQEEISLPWIPILAPGQDRKLCFGNVYRRQLTIGEEVQDDGN